MADKIYIQIGDKKQEAKGEVLEQILKDQAEDENRISLIEAAEKEKADKKQSATNKLKALGLTDSEVEALLG
jgi:copper oxidase (laccase) domain-containing protein